MTDQRRSNIRSYIDPETGEILLLIHDRHRNGWIPSIAAMDSWRAGRIRIYSPTDRTDRFITMPEHIHWPLLTPLEETNIRAILTHPWIPDGQSIEGLRDAQIDDFDALQQLLVTDRAPYTFQHVAPTRTLTNHHRMLDALLRPTLLMDTPLTLMPVQQFQQLQLQQMPSIDLMTILASSARPPDRPPDRPSAFPKHLTDQVLASAEAAGQTCPITMEPIKKTSASITSCGHIFQKTAITHWMQDHNTCPECRQPCTI